jgi:hypothetical protein
MKTKSQPLLQAVLLLAIVGIGSAWFLSEPGTPDVRGIDIDHGAMDDRRTTTTVVAETSRWPNLGQKDIFQPLIPPPTPPPRTPRPPQKLPPIQTMLNGWSINYVLKDSANFEDKRTKESFTLKLGESKVVGQGRNQLAVTLIKVSQREFKVTFAAPSFKNSSELTQEFVLEMF